jgi:hypothetical protein
MKRRSFTAGTVLALLSAALAQTGPVIASLNPPGGQEEWDQNPSNRVNSSTPARRERSWLTTASGSA